MSCHAKFWSCKFFFSSVYQEQYLFYREGIPIASRLLTSTMDKKGIKIKGQKNKKKSKEKN